MAQGGCPRCGAVGDGFDPVPAEAGAVIVGPSWLKIPDADTVHGLPDGEAFLAGVDVATLRMSYQAIDALLP